MKALMYTKPAKMDGFTVLEPGVCELMDIPEPELKPEEGMKIRIDYTAMCATDAHVVTMGLYGAPCPQILGHETMGTIVEITESGEDAGFEVGDKVVVNGSAPCGCCDQCKRGNDNACYNKIFGQVFKMSGAFTEYVTAYPQQCFRIPDDPPVDPKYYCLTEPLATAMEGIDLADIKIGNSVLLQGCGAIGSIILNMLVLRGCTSITVSDPVPEKRETARKLGAQYLIDPTTENLEERAMEITDFRGYDIIFDVAGVPSAAPLLPDLLAYRGKLVYFAVFPMDYKLPLSLYDLYLKEGRIQTVYTSFYNIPRSMDLLPRMDLDTIVTKEMKLSDGVEIFNEFLRSKNNKIIVKCSDL